MRIGMKITGAAALYSLELVPSKVTCLVPTNQVAMI